jgi:hypothetical protein
MGSTRSPARPGFFFALPPWNFIVVEARAQSRPFHKMICLVTVTTVTTVTVTV